MRIVAAAAIVFFVNTLGFAQAQSVLVEELTGQEVQAAVAAGKTTAIYCSGSVHADGPAIAMGKHAILCRHVAQRAAEELGNALVLPINPYAINAGQMNQTSRPSGSVVAGTTSLSEEVYGLMTKDIVNSAIQAAGFRHVMVMGDHSQGQQTLKRVASELDREWRSKGVRVHFIEMADTSKPYLSAYLTKQGVVEDKVTARHTRIHDAVELLSIDRERKWVRTGAIPAEDRPIVTTELGTMSLNFKVNSVVQEIRTAIAGGTKSGANR